MNAGASFGESISVAVASLRSSKLRSFLTLLGIILATSTLIAVMSVIRGMDNYIADAVSSMGANGFRVVRLAIIGQVDPKKYLELVRRNPEIRIEEYAFLKSKATLLKELGMEMDRTASLRYGTDSIDSVSLRGVTPNMAVITNIEASAGRFITDTENAHRVEVVFIGSDIQERFFQGVDPIGKTMQVNRRPFTVVGVAKKQGSLFGQSRDNFVIIPAETLFKTEGARRGIGFYGLALDREHFNQAQDEVRMLLRAFRGLGPKDEDNFSIFSSDSIIAMWNQLTSVIAATAVTVVSVFMIVGGVVIMNIMLAVVTERTHEIGIRKAVGARNGDILNQFLVESSLLAATGGLMGVLLAWVVAVVVRNYTPVPMALPYSAVAVGVGLSTAVGLFFGIYPARRAAMLDPIEALRAEK
jgi:putative ABC transport system permease protein